VFPKAYFRALKEVFGEDCDVVTVEWQGRGISSVLNFYFRDTVLPYYGGGTEEARVLAANDFMYWEVMRRATERGYRIFDFGRSKLDSGSFAFKKHWGFEPSSLEYRFYLRRLSEPPELNPANPKYRAMVAIWKRIPVRLSKLLGPVIARHLG
jgi:FemAB-related protein (PEP-CTERM system-associated)